MASLRGPSGHDVTVSCVYVVFYRHRPVCSTCKLGRRRFNAWGVNWPSRTALLPVTVGQVVGVALEATNPFLPALQSRSHRRPELAADDDAAWRGRPGNEKDASLESWRAEATKEPLGGATSRGRLAGTRMAFLGWATWLDPWVSPAAVSRPRDSEDPWSWKVTWPATSGRRAGRTGDGGATGRAAGAFRTPDEEAAIPAGGTLGGKADTVWVERDEVPARMCAALVPGTLGDAQPSDRELDPKYDAHWRPLKAVALGAPPRRRSAPCSTVGAGEAGAERTAEAVRTLPTRGGLAASGRLAVGRVGRAPWKDFCSAWELCSSTLGVDGTARPCKSAGWVACCGHVTPWNAWSSSWLGPWSVGLADGVDARRVRLGTAGTSID